MPVTPTIEVDDTLKERSSHGSFEQFQSLPTQSSYFD